jgi:hypothetical protein
MRTVAFLAADTLRWIRDALLGASEWCHRTALLIDTYARG